MVAIKHFGMPSCCDNCDIFDWADKACHITYTKCENPFDDKNDDCPLIEIEPQESEDKCKNCEYYFNPDYTRCHECKAESENKE